MIEQRGVPTIEAFGTASGRLTDPYADRKAILAELGLDEAGWKERVTAFRASFRAAATTSQGRAQFARYRAAFELARGTPAPSESTPEPVVASVVAEPPSTAPAAPVAPIGVPSYRLAENQSPLPERANAPVEARPVAHAHPRPSFLLTAAPRQPPSAMAPAQPVAAAPMVSPPEIAAPVGSGTAFAPPVAVVKDATPFKTPNRLGSGTAYAAPLQAAGAAVPFKAPTGAGSPSASSTAKPQEERVATGTVLAPVDAPVGPPTPFQAPESDGISQTGPRELLLEQYVHVTATLRRASASELPAALALFGLTPETRAALDARWKARMDADPTLAIRYAVLLVDQR